MSGYTYFSQYYDILTDNVSYKTIAGRIDGLVDRFSGRKNIFLDLACGTGSLSEEAAKLGYDVIGVDLSQEMLSEAINKKIESGYNIQYLCQDMRELDMYGTVDVTVCVLDSLNHLESIDDVRKVFERVSLFAFPDGLFVFDVNTLYKHRNVLADNAFVYDKDDVFCVWQNSLRDDNSTVDIRLDFFSETEKGRYVRCSEEFSETAYELSAIKKLLKDTGFEILGVYDGYTDNERAVFAARKCR